MCEPATIMAAGSFLAAHAGTALTIASTAAGIGGSIASYDQQNAYAKATRQAATSAYEQQSAALTHRQEQEQTAAAERTFQNQREYDAARARAVVSAEAGGVQGLSVNALLNDLAGQQAVRQNAIGKNTDWAIQSLQQDKLGAAAARDSRINSAPRASGMGLALQIGGQAATGFDKFKSATDPKWGKPPAPRPMVAPRNLA
jgi:hypothetical protein